MKFRHLYHNKKIVALAIFSENFEMNVVYFSKACALNYFSFDDFYIVTFVYIFAVFVCK